MTSYELMADALSEMDYGRPFRAAHGTIHFTTGMRVDDAVPHLQPFKNTLEGYRQRSLLMNWLNENHSQLITHELLLKAIFEDFDDWINGAILRSFEQLAGEGESE